MTNKISNEQIMKIAIEESKYNKENNYTNGGPFGAVIVKDNKIISKSHNTVIESKDVTAHAEINAIREASKLLGTYNLEGCTIYSTAEPCPMCLSAIIWSNIKKIYYVNTKEDVDNIGFRDDIIYKYLKNNNGNIIEKIKLEDKEALEVFKDFKNITSRKMY